VKTWSFKLRIGDTSRPLLLLAVAPTIEEREYEKVLQDEE
jgi:hypothetical protein